METAIGTGIDQIKVNGVPYASTYEGPNGPELAYNITGLAKDASGTWNFTITNGNDFPVAMDWDATVHSDVYPQEFGLDLSTPALNVTLFAPWAAPLDLSDVRQVPIADALATVLASAPTAYTSPSGIEFARVNVSLWANITGAVVLDGLSVRYFLDVNVTGPGVIAAAEAFRAAHEAADTIELPIAVRSSCDASVLLSGPYLLYDLRPVFVTTTQTVAEDGNRTVDLDTLFGDDLDRGNLRYELRSVSDAANMTADINGSLLTMTPAHDFYGELDVVVRGIDSSDLFKDGNIHVVVTAVNDLPVLSAPAEFAAQARVTSVVDLAPLLTDVDTAKGALVLAVNTSSISVDGLELDVTFDEEGMYHVELTVTDGLDEAHFELLFNVSAAVGFPSISASLPDPMKVHRNRDLKVDLSLYASDGEDASSELAWTVMSDSDLFTAVINASRHWLIITPKGSDMGADDILLTLTDTDDHTVSRSVTVEIIDRLLEQPQIDEAALPDEIDLTKGGKSVVLELGDFVRDDTPVRLLLVSITYGADGIVYVDTQGGNLTFVPQGTGKTRVTVTLTDTDGLSSTFDVDVEVKPKGGGDEANWWLWVALLSIVALILIVVAWPKRPVAAPPTSTGGVVVEEPAGKRVERVRPHLFTADPLPQLEEVMLFHKDGTLVSQHTRRMREGVDAEIEAGVISAIQDNLRGRSRTRGETPDLIELEGMRVVVERGADVAIASVLTGDEPDSLRMLMRRTLHEVQTRNDGALKAWKGDLGALRGVDNAIVGLVESLIRESGGVPARGAAPVKVEPRPEPRRPDWGGEEAEEAREAPVAHKTDDGEPLRLVGGIIGEEKVQELREGKPKLHTETKDDVLVKEMLDREKEKETEEENGA
jgi:hypothetical protein